MNQETYEKQIKRLQTRWKNAFDPEFVALLGVRTKDIPNDAFVEIVNFFIGNRPVSKPPLMQDFIDAKIRTEKQAFNRDVYGAVRALERDASTWNSDGLSKFLARDYPGCKTLNEAVKVQILRNQIARAKGES